MDEEKNTFLLYLGINMYFNLLFADLEGKKLRLFELYFGNFGHCGNMHRIKAAANPMQCGHIGTFPVS